MYHYLGILKKWYRECCFIYMSPWYWLDLEPDWVLNTDTGELLHGFFPTRNQYQSLSHNKW
jgi:hypothetical protein